MKFSCSRPKANPKNGWKNIKQREKKFNKPQKHTVKNDLPLKCMQFRIRTRVYTLWHKNGINLQDPTNETQSHIQEMNVFVLLRSYAALCYALCAVRKQFKDTIHVLICNFDWSLKIRSEGREEEVNAIIYIQFFIFTNTTSKAVISVMHSPIHAQHIVLSNVHVLEPSYRIQNWSSRTNAMHERRNKWTKWKHNNNNTNHRVLEGIEIVWKIPVHEQHHCNTYTYAYTLGVGEHFSGAKGSTWNLLTHTAHSIH